jgi:hypothetical protein
VKQSENLPSFFKQSITVLSSFSVTMYPDPTGKQITRIDIKHKGFHFIPPFAFTDRPFGTPIKTIQLKKKGNTPPWRIQWIPSLF